ncbi:response regulator transcription factor [Streptomyces kronopolitis]|uniref:response regulator transcription factor n=1 Tax=Streptomyces kronopolitis TaxID=1612435 RepID=UPI0034423753
MTSVLLVDDDAAVRAGLRTIIESGDGLIVVGEAWDGRQALEEARRLQPDIVVMDIRMPGMNGIAATRALRAVPAPPAVLVLTTFGHEEDYVEQALAAGAVGFLLKDAPPGDFLTALRDIAAGTAAFAASVTGRVIDAVLRTAPPTTADGEAALIRGLTRRQRDVLTLLAGGMSNAAIGAELGMSEGTVKGYVSEILTRLGADNRVQAARIAYRARLGAKAG